MPRHRDSGGHQGRAPAAVPSESAGVPSPERSGRVFRAGRILAGLAAVVSIGCGALPEVVVLNDDGAWNWLQDERAVVVGHRLVVASVAMGCRDPGREGAVEVVSRDLRDGALTRFTLHREAASDQRARWRDDHSCPALLVRPESRRDTEAPASAQKPAGKDVYKPTYDNTAHNLERVPVAEKEPVKPAATGELVPATIDIVSAKEEMRVGDRMLPEPPRVFPNYVPRAPGQAQNGLIVSVYGNAVRYAAQNQVVAINRGKAHGLEDGHVLALVRDANTLTDKTDDSRPQLRLPGESNGLMMVFRTFDKVSYAVVLNIQDGVKIGDRFTNP